MAKNQSIHKPMATANALATTGAVFYIACTLLVSFSRPMYMYLASGWMHGININSLPAATMMGGGLFGGLITFTVASWIAGYVFARFYNWFASM